MARKSKDRQAQIPSLIIHHSSSDFHLFVIQLNCLTSLVLKLSTCICWLR